MVLLDLYSSVFWISIIFTLKLIEFVHKFPAKKTVTEKAPTAAFPREVY